jgi:hypothetical protein
MGSPFESSTGPRHTCTLPSLPTQSILQAGLYTDVVGLSIIRVGDRCVRRSKNEPSASGASSVKKGAKKDLFVAFPSGGLLSESTRADTPSTSERRINSWRIGVHVWPVRVRKLIVFIHSSVVMLRACHNHESTGWSEHGSRIHNYFFTTSGSAAENDQQRTHFVSETNSWSLLTRFLKMNLVRLPFPAARALQCAEM